MGLLFGTMSGTANGFAIWLVHQANHFHDSLASLSELLVHQASCLSEATVLVFAAVCCQPKGAAANHRPTAAFWSCH